MSCHKLSFFVLGLSAFSTIAPAATERTLVAFTSPAKPGQLNTGVNPRGTLLRDAAGALYGANMLGGAYYNGTIFKLTPPAAGQTGWTLSILYTFMGGTDGGLPNSGLVMDSSGAIYGTADSGGYSWLNQGVVFKLTPPAPGTTQWHYSVIHSFYHSYAYGADDGANPGAGLVMDRYGNLYGTTNLGGNIASLNDYGTVYKLTPLDAAKTKWQETVLYRFQGGADGSNPMTALTLDVAGALYGVTLYGGSGRCTDMLGNIIGCGTVFKLAPPAAGQSAWKKTTIRYFTGPDGNQPVGRLFLDAYGILYGTTFQGGSGRCTDGLLNIVGCGIVFKMTPPTLGQTAWNEYILHDFTGGLDGAFPQGGVIPDASGALVGTTSGGGPSSYGVGNSGVVFRLVAGQAGWTETALFNFNPSTSGDTAVGELIRDPYGNFYGVGHQGGPQYGGTVYEITMP